MSSGVDGSTKVTHLGAPGEERIREKRKLVVDMSLGYSTPLHPSKAIPPDGPALRLCSKPQPPHDCLVASLQIPTSPVMSIGHLCQQS